VSTSGARPDPFPGQRAQKAPNQALVIFALVCAFVSRSFLAYLFRFFGHSLVILTFFTFQFVNISQVIGCGGCLFCTSQDIWLYRSSLPGVPHMTVMQKSIIAGSPSTSMM